MSIKIRSLVPVLLVAFFVCWPVMAQLPTATLLGVVTDDSGSVVPGALLSVKNVDNGQTRSVTTDDHGSYRVLALSVGNYEVRATKQGFETIIIPGITLTVSQEATVNVTLRIGALEQVVTVSGGIQTVDTDSATLGGLVDERKLADLPLNGRNFVQLALNETGVVQNTNTTSTGGFGGTMLTINGASIRSNAFLLDGAPMQNAFGANGASIAGTTLGVDGIREFRIITNAFGAEYGTVMGGQVLLVSQSGTNALHGSAFDYLRNNDLDARNFFDPKSLPPFERNNFGGSLGGPIRRDKTFIFGTYEGLKQRLGVTEVTNVLGAGCHGPAGTVVTNTVCPQLGSTPSVTISPTIAPILALFPAPNSSNNQYRFPFNQPFTEEYGQVRVDQNFSTKDTLFGRYTMDNADQTTAVPYPQFKYVGHSQNQYITGAENHIFSPTLLNTLRFSYSQTVLGTASPSGITGPGYSLVPGQEIGVISVGGTTSMGPDGPSPSNYNQFLENYSDDLFYTKGRHSVKFGVSINRYDDFLQNSSGLRGTLTFASISTFLAAKASTTQAETPGSVLHRDYLYSVMGFYAQDDYKIHPRLTLNLGLRYEPATVPSETSGLSAALRNIVTDGTNTIGPPWRNFTLKNFSPRVGFAWTATRDGKTAVRGSFSELYDVGNIGSLLIIGVVGTAPFSTISNVTSPPTLTIPLSFSNATLTSSQRTPDYNMKQSHMLQYSFSVQRQLPWNLIATAAYAGSRGLDLIRTIEGNPITPQILNGQPFWPVGDTTRRNPNWGFIALNTSQGNSQYNAIQLELLKRLASGLQFQASYTLSRSIGSTLSQLSSDSSSVNVFNTNPLNYNQDKSVLSSNVPNNFRFNTIYNLPRGSLNGFVGGFLNGWWVSSIVSVQTGLPFTIALNSNRSRSGVAGGASGIDRPDLVPGFTSASITSGTTAGCLGVPAGGQVGTPTLFYNPCAFALQVPGTLGNAGQNILYGPGEANIDFSLVKDTAIRKLGEAGKLQFRAEIFNLFNHPFFAEPNRIVFAGTAAGSGSNLEAPLSTAGVISSTLAPSRQIQLALKLVF